MRKRKKLKAIAEKNNKKNFKYKTLFIAQNNFNQSNKIVHDS